MTGYAPLSYLNHLRMQHAVQLLNSTDLPIKQISDQLGFSEQFYFSRAFSKMHNHSPSEHRRRYSTRALPSQSALVQAGDRESHGHISHTGWRASGESQCRRRLEHVRAVRINIRNSRLGLGRAGDCQNRGNEEMNQLEAAGFRDAL